MLTINIELNVSHLDPRKDAIMLKIVRVIAKQMLAQASMIADERQPKLRITAEDNHNPETTVELFDKEGNELDTDIDPEKMRPGTYGLSALALNKLMENIEE